MKSRVTDVSDNSPARHSIFFREISGQLPTHPPSLFRFGLESTEVWGLGLGFDLRVGS